MKRRFFITGTGTSVGKTVVTAALLQALRQRGQRCIPVKPVQTGWQPGGSDIGWCLSFTGRDDAVPDPDALVVYRLDVPASPHLAAERAGCRISMATILEKLDALQEDWDILLIEGAGGLLAPLNENETMLDLIKASDAEPLVVAHSGLGTLNHTLLTFRELKRNQLAPSALVVNDVEPVTGETARIIREDNLRYLRVALHPTPLAVIPFQREWSTGQLAALGGPLADLLFK